MRLRGEGGQSTVELALCLPVVALLLGAVLEVGMIAADRNRVWHSAREAARAASVTSDQQKIETAAEASGLDGLVVEVSPGPHYRVQGEPVTVTVTYRPGGHLPVVGALLSALELTAHAAMRIEQP